MKKSIILVIALFFRFGIYAQNVEFSKDNSKERKDEWNESYYIQASAYAEMYRERTSIQIDQIVILVVTEDGVVQEFVKDKSVYIPLLKESVETWKQLQ